MITDALTPAVLEAAEHGTWAEALWEQLETQGLTQPSAIARSGRSSRGVRDRSCGCCVRPRATAVPLPVAETALAGWFLTQQGIEVPRWRAFRCVDFEYVKTLSYEGGRVSGSLARVPWGREVSAIVAIVAGKLVLLDRHAGAVTQGVNM